MTGAGGRRKTTTMRRIAVSAEKYADDAEEATYVPPKIDKADDIKKQIRDGLGSNPLFEQLESDLLDQIVDAVDKMECEAGKTVIQQGDAGDNFYIVGSGELEAFIKATGDEPIQVYHAGDTFGELALLYNSPRAATVKCKDAVVLWALDRKAFRALVTKHNTVRKHGLTDVLRTVPLISEFEPEQIQAMADAVDMQEYEAGEYIIQMGDEAESLFIILAGEVTCHLGDGKELMRQKEGSFFGESCLNVGAASRQANVVAVGHVRCAILKATSFQQLFGSAQDVINRNFNMKVLSGVELIRAGGLGPSELESLASTMKESTYESGATILEQGVTGTTFFIIKSGAVECLTDDTKVAELKKLDYFGERSLLTAENTNAKVVVSGGEPAILMSLDKDNFEAQLGPLKELMEKENKKRDAAATKAAKITWEELEVHSVLGEGSFGRVKLTLHTPTRNTYALKCLRKGQLLKFQQVEHVVNEKRVMEMCDHPFVLKLAGVFNNNAEIYMLIEIALGGELFTLLRSAGKFEEDHACLYASMVAAAFAYLHARKIAHRDLKPENLLFDTAGYLKLVDFGFAKVVRDRTWTLCGTPEYLAPEIISNKGHNVGADWWTMGILLYEMLVGHPPFVAESQMETYHKIMRGKYKIPQNFPRAAKDMISKLLTYNPAGRLGCWKNGAKDVINHDFFKSIDWQKLVNKELKVPYVPTISDPLDTSNFDQYPMEDNSSWDKYNDPAYESIWVKEFAG